MMAKKKKWEEFYSSVFTEEEYYGNNNYHIEFLNWILELKPNSILEAGCGTASMSIFLSQKIPKVFALDNNQKVLEIAKKNNEKFGGRVTFIMGDIFNIPLDVDLIFHQGVLEHFSDWKIKLCLYRQLLKTQIVVFSVPTKFYPYIETNLGDERLLTIEDWEKIVGEFIVGRISYYSNKQQLLVDIRRGKRRYFYPKYLWFNLRGLVKTKC